MGTYSAPTSVFSIHIAQTGRLNDNFLPTTNVRGSSDVAVEADYPIPSILLAVIAIVTKIPETILMFLPISAIGSVILFIIARRVLKGTNAGLYSLLLATFYFLFMSVAYMHATYAGRATFGDVTLAYFFFSYMMFLYVCVNGTSKSEPWFIVSYIFAVLTGLTYYTSTLAIIILVSGITMVCYFYVRKLILILSAFTVITLSALLFIQHDSLVSLSGGMVPQDFLDNIIQYVRIRLLGIQEVTATCQLIKIDRLTSDLRFFSSVLTFASMLAIILGILIFRPKRKSKTLSFIWLFSIAVFLIGLSEFGYALVTPSFPTRFYLMFGLIIFLYIMITVSLKIGITAEAGKRNLSVRLANSLIASKMRVRMRKIVAVALVVIIVLACAGNFMYGWRYGLFAAKPDEYSVIQPLATFTCLYSSYLQPVVLTGDATYTANLFMIAESLNKTNSVIPEGISQDAVSLYNWALTCNGTEFLKDMNRRQIDYLIMVNSSLPFWGDDWGFTVPPINASILNNTYDCVYNNGQSQLYRLPGAL